MVCECALLVKLCIWFTEPPVSAGEYVSPAPTKNLSRKSGVKRVPSHKRQVNGISAIAPDQSFMVPRGKSRCTKGVGSERL